MATYTFAELSRWAEKTIDQKRRIMQASAQEVADQSIQNTPVDTGFLRNSVVSDLNGGRVAEGENGYVLAIAQMEPGDVLRFGFTAEYAEPVEFGARGRVGVHYVGRAVAQWQEIVERNARAVR